MKILSFDIEDWWVYNYYNIGNIDDWLPRIDNYLSKTLDLLDERSIKATFFILGEVAKHYPDVVKRIAKRGHHIGCHSFSHNFLGKCNREAVIKDTQLAIASIEDCIGYKVNAYRAPAFSITEKNKWVLEVLVENGIKYDCSIFPAVRSFGGFPTYPVQSPSIIEISGYKIKEFPMSPVTIMGHKFIYSGGGYFRLFPYWKIKSLAKNSDYVMTYFHIKDFDKNQKRRYHSLENESAAVRYMKNYYGLKTCFDKFCRFVSDFDFVSVETADKQINWNELSVIKL